MSSVLDVCKDSTLILVESDLHLRISTAFANHLWKTSFDDSNVIFVRTELKRSVSGQPLSASEINCWNTNRQNWIDLQDIRSQILERVSRAQSPQCVVLYTLDPFITSSSPNVIAKFLLSLSAEKQIGRIVALLSRGVLAQDIVHTFKSVFQSTVSLKRSKASYEENNFLYECSVRHFPCLGNKPTLRDELISVDIESGKVIIKEALKADNLKAKEGPEAENQERVLSSLTTFNLGLSNREKEARDKLVLPFWKEEQIKPEVREEAEEDVVRITKPVNKKSEEGSAKIFYTPEENDDWDEEDPDDDLDF